MARSPSFGQMPLVRDPAVQATRCVPACLPACLPAGEDTHQRIDCLSSMVYWILCVDVRACVVK